MLKHAFRHTLDGFLGAAECAQLISIVDPFLGRSTRNAYDPGSCCTNDLNGRRRAPAGLAVEGYYS
jgi:hypothetical protein